LPVTTILQRIYKEGLNSVNFSGIHIGTNEDSSWFVSIDLFDTSFETKEFNTIIIHREKDDWVQCCKENSIFKGHGGVQNLEDILNIFYKWVTNN
jgi:hypothetical protein